MRYLIRDYKIVFRGLLSPSQWPADYCDLFTRVRNIRLIEFDTFKGDGRFSSVDKLKRNAYKLVDVAIDDRIKRVKEIQLRLSTEPLVFRRFEEEIKWSGVFFFVFFLLPFLLSEPILILFYFTNIGIIAPTAANFAGFPSFQPCQTIQLKQKDCKIDERRGCNVIVLQIRGHGRMGMTPSYTV
jgi:hypothetical protein